MEVLNQHARQAVPGLPRFLASPLVAFLMIDARRNMSHHPPGLSKRVGGGGGLRAHPASTATGRGLGSLGRRSGSMSSTVTSWLFVASARFWVTLGHRRTER